MAILTGFTREERATIEARATALVKERGVKCSCGSDPRHPGWHHEGCALEDAWDRYCDEAADELEVLEEAEERRQAEAAEAEAIEEAEAVVYGPEPPPEPDHLYHEGKYVSEEWLAH